MGKNCTCFKTFEITTTIYSNGQFANSEGSEQVCFLKLLLEVSIRSNTLKQLNCQSEQMIGM